MAILTISREIGSGGRGIGYNISRLLNYEYIDKEKIFSDIRADGKNGKNGEKHLMSADLQYGKNMTGLFRLGERSFKVIFSLMPLKIM